MDQTKLLDLQKRFKHHPPSKADTILRHEKVRASCLDTAAIIETLVPDGREKSLATTKLEEAMMWANAGIARALSADPTPVVRGGDGPTATTPNN